jgi:hypothetical protein
MEMRIQHIEAHYKRQGEQLHRLYSNHVALMANMYSIQERLRFASLTHVSLSSAREMQGDGYSSGYATYTRQPQQPPNLYPTKYDWNSVNPFPGVHRRQDYQQTQYYGRSYPEQSWSPGWSLGYRGPADWGNRM